MKHGKVIYDPFCIYSEDIDLVQRKPEPIGNTINLIQDILNPIFMVKAKVSRWQGRVSVIYRFKSETEPQVPMRLKIEINM